MESHLDLDGGAKHVKELADAFGRLKLHRLLLLGEAGLNIRHESFESALVQGRVIQQRLLDEANQLALRDRGINFRLGQLEEQLQARHLVVLLQLVKDQKSLVLYIAIL